MTTAKVPWLGQLVEVTLLPIKPAKGDQPALMMYEEAAHAFVQMDAAARQDGITLNVNTAFRDHEYQKRLYAEYMAAKAAGKPHAVVAVPGTSDHERGLSVDIETGVPESLRTASKAEKARSSKIYKWLYENAEKWGFENDVSSEPWHWTHKVRVLNAAAAAKAAGGSAIVLLIAGGSLWWWLKRGNA